MKFGATVGAGVLLAALAAGQSGPCDRACLDGFVDRYLDAVAAHNPKALPLARNVKFTENGQKLEIGDGLWNSMAGKGAYRLFVTDAQTGQVAYIGTIREEARNPAETAPAVMALRLKIENRQIAEVETFVVRNERAAQNLEKLGRSQSSVHRGGACFGTNVPRRAHQDSEHVFFRDAAK